MIRIREKHLWPPQIVVHPHWEAEFAERADALELAVTSAHDAARDVKAHVLGIAATVDET